MRQLKVWFAVSFSLIAILFAVVFLASRMLPQPVRKAPEIQHVLDAEPSLPFQVLIPAYLPKRFDRAAVEIKTDATGPLGEPMVQLVYTDRYGNTVTLSQWVPADRVEPESTEETAAPVVIFNADHTQAVTERDSLRVFAQVSSYGVLAPEQLKLMMDTLGIARGMEIYDSTGQVPIEKSLPPAVPVEVNAEGVQEVTLIVAPGAYSPPHFSVEKGLPVRMIFTQYGEVGCGNELWFQWGDGQFADLVLTGSGDSEILEFTPQESGVFPFNCPHSIYVGAMTVND